MVIRCAFSVPMFMFLVSVFLGCGAHSEAPTGNVTVSVAVADLALSSLGGLGLVTGDTWVGTISGCDSGATLSVSQNAPTVPLPLGDQHCVLGLSSLVVAGEAFVFPPAAAFKPADVYMLAGSQGSTLRFAIKTNLDPILRGDQHVVMSYNLIEQGSDQTVSASVGVTTTVNKLIPINLDVVKVTLGVADDGSGLFNFKLQCYNPVVKGACDSYPLANFQARLVVDQTQGVLTIDKCLSLFGNNAGSSVQAFPAGGDSEAPTGGFSTGDLMGPKPLYAGPNRHMLLAIASSAGGCKFFKVALTKP